MNELESMFRNQMSDNGYSVVVERYTAIRDGSHLYTILMKKGGKGGGNGQHDRNDSDTKRIFREGSEGN